MRGATVQGVSTVGEWLEQLDPVPPPALASRLSESLAKHLHRPVSEIPEACLEAGEALLVALLATGSTNRTSALDLLAVDALITYAFESAANEPSELLDRATRAMQRIASLPPADNTT